MTREDEFEGTLLDSLEEEEDDEESEEDEESDVYDEDDMEEHALAQLRHDLLSAR